jgi:ribosome maturation factor RimP
MKLDPEIVAQLRDLVRDQGLELVATESAGSGPKMVLRLVVDGPDGVSLDRCADISREASALLDVEDPISHRYTLEVSSPGLDRKFYSAADYDRFAGQRVAIRMQPSYREHRTASGRLEGLSADGVVRLLADDGATLELPFAQVFETRLEVDWDQVMKEGKKRR